MDFQHTEGSKLLVMNPLIGGPCGPVIHHFPKMRSMQIRQSYWKFLRVVMGERVSELVGSRTAYSCCRSVAQLNSMFLACVSHREFRLFWMRETSLASGEALPPSVRVHVSSFQIIKLVIVGIIMLGVDIFVSSTGDFSIGMKK